MMRKQVLAMLVVTMSVTACGSVRDSRLNPFNWFGRSTSTSVAVSSDKAAVNPLIPRRNSIFAKKDAPAYAGTLVQAVTDMRVRRVPGGAVVEVTGVFTSQGSYDVRLIKVEDTDPGTLTYEFRALQPRQTTGLGTQLSRTVTAARDLTDQDLAGIRTIRVVAKQNVRTVRR